MVFVEQEGAPQAIERETLTQTQPQNTSLISVLPARCARAMVYGDVGEWPSNIWF